MEAIQTNATSFAILTGSVRCVSSKLNPLVLKALDIVLICHRSLYIVKADESGLKDATIANSIWPSRLTAFMLVRYTHFPSILKILG